VSISPSGTSGGLQLTKLRDVLADVRLDDELARLTIEATTEGFWDWNVQTGTVRFSDSWLRSLGYERADVEPHVSAWKKLLHPDDVEKTMAAVEAHLHGQTEIYECENRVLTRSGRYRWNRDRGKVIAWTEDGKPLRMVGSDTDLSEQASAKAVFQAAFESAPNGMLLIGPDGLITQANRALQGQFGYSADELIGQTTALLVPPESREEHDRLVERFLRTAEQRDMGEGRQLAGYRKDGSQLPVRISLNRCAAEEEPFVIATVVDLSGQIERDRFFELSSDMLCIARADGYFSRVNPAFTRTLGWTERELLSKPFLDFVHEDDREETSEYFVRLLKGEVSGEFENRYRDNRNEFRWISWTVSPLEQGSGLIFAAGRDVTKAHAAAQAIEEAHARDARQADELSRANEDLEHFVYAASHDLQEPVRNIVAYCDLLREDLGEGLPETAEQDLAYIQHGARRMRSLIQELLALSRAGRSKIGFAAVSLAACARDATEALDQKISETRAHIEFGNLPDVRADRLLLTQTLQNLVNNALKFVRQGERPFIRIEALENDDEFEVRVSDKGIGIDPGKQAEIFKPFARLHGREEYAGSGIGLAICRKAVDRHGGRIWVESSEWGGSSFRFTLPKDLD